ncbi:MAG: HupE/UreJ family protein [Nitrosomonadales bacterium]|nr:HupE/UreJ family protein [Nitrosomonadales bacterium]
MKRILFAIVSMLPTLASAHIGSDAGIHHDSAFIMGFIHPLTGLDHMLAMIAVGIWSMQNFRNSRRSVWIPPFVFASLLLLGGIIGFSGAIMFLVEPMIATSLLVLGLFVALRIKLPLMMGAALVGTFAIFHGFAHGSELPAAQVLSSLSGMVIGTMLLHMAGMLLGRFVLEHNGWLPRIAGAAVAFSGLGLLSGAF